MLLLSFFLGTLPLWKWKLTNYLYGLPPRLPHIVPQREDIEEMAAHLETGKRILPYSVVPAVKVLMTK